MSQGRALISSRSCRITFLRVRGKTTPPHLKYLCGLFVVTKIPRALFNCYQWQPRSIVPKLFINVFECGWPISHCKRFLHSLLSWQESITAFNAILGETKKVDLNEAFLSKLFGSDRTLRLCPSTPYSHLQNYFGLTMIISTIQLYPFCSRKKRNLRFVLPNSKSKIVINCLASRHFRQSR